MKAQSALVAVAALMVAGGCGNRSSSSSALDIVDPYAPSSYSSAQPSTPSAQPVSNPQPAPQNVVYDTQPVTGYQTPPTQQPITAGSTYQVKRGDTLFSIAKSRYGNGNQWQKIAAANPGLTPQNLKAGQTIVIP
ncbi:MAG: LysM peptidoglycan-binding domain-containing protein [Phycisphaerales bacterium]|nr:LysM peptidoglycan-binding domain-containing protein [Phycisphaerales bacterium]